MIPPDVSATAPDKPLPGDRWRQTWLVVLAATLVLFTIVLVGRLSAESGPVGNPAAAGSPLATGPAASPTGADAPGVPGVPGSGGAPGSSGVPGAPGGGVSGVPASGVPGSGASGVPGLAGANGMSTSPLASTGAPGSSPAASGTGQPSTVADSGPFPAAGVLKLPGPVPTRGSGRFDHATRRGPVAGSKGPLRRYRVAVERGSNEDVQAFAEQVAATLGDSRSWSGGGRERLQMVGGSEPADFTVFLATRETAGLMCARGGTNIRIGGVPFTSCRTTGKAIINLDRWRGSAKPFLRARVGLATYRQYVINHEVGHELGHRHQNCPKAGGPAPVMVQQTITLRGCKPYAWPRRGNRDFAGPLL